MRDALHRLERRELVRLASGPAVVRRSTAICSQKCCRCRSGERAVMSVLMLRGAQTPGELKQRTERMHAFADLAGCTRRWSN